MGFLLTLVTIHLIPVVVDLIGWRFAFSILVPGPVIGILAMWRLRQSPDAARLAGADKSLTDREFCTISLINGVG